MSKSHSVYKRQISPPKPSQRRPIAGREEEMAKNHAGGYAFKVDRWTRLDRFLILGSEANTYYQHAKQLTAENAKNVLACIAEDGQRAVNRIVEISDSGRAPKNDPAIFALALACKKGDEITRRLAYSMVPKVCRTGTHLFHFVDYINTMGGWGRGARRAVAEWYQQKTPDNLAYQVVKYRQRDGWDHKQVLRVSHPSGNGPEHNALYRWITQKDTKGWPNEITYKRYLQGKKDNVATKEYPALGQGFMPNMVALFEVAQAAKVGDKDDKAALLSCIEQGLPMEAVPDEWKNDKDVWAALLEKLPLEATIRNLGKMSAIELIRPMSTASAKIIARLGDAEYIRRSRLHPFKILVALRTYQQGHGVKGALTWTPDPRVVDALDSAFYLAYANVEPTNKATMLALDVSGSMGSPELANLPGITPRVASAAMSLVTAATEPNYMIFAFCDRFVPIDISPKMRLDDVIRKVSGLPFGGTDCSLPMIYAKQQKLEIESFAVYTDSETWAGRSHPSEELKSYREKAHIASKLAVVGMTATDFTIADPTDPGMLDVVGMDSDVPAIIADFFRG